MPASQGHQSALSLILLFCVVVAAASTIHAASSVSLGSKLLAGDTTGWVSSPNKLFRLAFYNNPANSNTFSVGVLYNAPAAASLQDTVVWTAGGDVQVGSTGLFELSADGNLQLRDDSATTVWNSSTAGIHVAAAAMGDDGNFVLLNASGATLWGSFDVPTDTLVFNQTLPQGKSLTAGAYSASMQVNGNLSLIYRDNDGYTYWSSNTARGTGSNYHAILESPGMLSVYEQSQVVGSWKSKDYTATSTPIRRLTFGSDGNLRIYSWSAGGSSPSWTVEWEALEDYCQIYAYCGPNGICAYNETSIICTCATQAGYDFNDGNSPRSGCKAIAGNEGQNCSDAALMVELNNTLLFVSSTENRIVHYGEVDCSGACLRNGVCIATTALSDGSGTCQFTATGSFFSGYRELSTSTNSYLKYCGPNVPPPGSSINVTVATGQTLGPRQRKRATAVSVVVSVLSTLAILVSLQVGLWWAFCRKNPRWGGYSAHFALMEYASGAPVQLTFREVRKATENFKTKLGEGGFGAVYKGELSTTSDTGGQGAATEVAVKRLEGLAEHGEKQFRMEMAVIGSTHHVNLVRLCGFCAEGKERVLVYEYMRNGSLDKYLFAGEEAVGDGYSEGDSTISTSRIDTTVADTGCRRNMDWDTRFSVLLGTARGITYLHQECHDCIIHSDIKPENILLDDAFTAKVSDFGLAKLTNVHQKPSGRHITTLVRGTRGYLAPEWRSNLPITIKSDVYSYGVVVLETVSGQRSFAATTRNVSFPEWAYHQYFHHKQVEGVVDERIREEVDKEQLERAMKVAFWCMQVQPSMRPSMSKVIQMLDGSLAVPHIPPMPKSFGDFSLIPSPLLPEDTSSDCPDDDSTAAELRFHSQPFIGPRPRPAHSLSLSLSRVTTSVRTRPAQTLLSL